MRLSPDKNPTRDRICIALLAAVVGCSGGAAPPQAGTAIELKIVAHQDDDLLFMNPDLADSIAAGRTVRTVFLTAGDAGRGAAYWARREEGILESYAAMASADNTWISSTPLVAGRPVQLRTLAKLPRISVIFLRLPDGNGHGGGFPATGLESLARLWTGKIPALHPLDGSSSYSKSELIFLLTRLMEELKAQSVDTQDWTGRFGGDHSDHIQSATFAHAAEKEYRAHHSTRVYRGYNLRREPINLLSDQQVAKEKIFLGYARHDGQLCSASGACKARHDYPLYLGRQYPFIPGNLVGPRGKCLEGLPGHQGVAMRTCRDLPEQKWTMDRQELRSGRGGCLSVIGPEGLNPPMLALLRCSDGSEQGWTLKPDGHLTNADGLCATLSVGGSDQGPDVFAAECGNVPQQKWRLYPK